MRRDQEYFGERELDLVYIARKLRDALRLEDVLTGAGIDYAVETDHYEGGVIFRSQRVGAFFYVLPEITEQVRATLRQNGFAPPL